MGVKVDGYIDLLNRYALYGDNGYYVDPQMIHRMVVDELKLSMSFESIEVFVETCKITLTEEEIENFLDKVMDEEKPTLKEQLNQPYKPNSKNILECTKEDIHKAASAFGTEILKSRYVFEPYSLQYFKKYTSILKEKCGTLLEILNDLIKIKDDTIQEEEWDRIIDLDFHINEFGDVYFSDIERLTNAIIYNVSDLYDKVAKGNSVQTYLTCKVSKDSIARAGIFESEIYPSKEVQIKDLYYSYRYEFIALSNSQKETLKKEQLGNFSRMLEQDLFDDYASPSIPMLVKTNR